MFSFNTFVYEWQSTLPINFHHYSQYLKIVCKSHCDNSTKSRILCTYFSLLDIATDVYGPCSKTNFSWKLTNAFCHRMLKCCSMVKFHSWKTDIEAFFVKLDLKATERSKNTGSIRTYLTSVRKVKFENTKKLVCNFHLPISII